MTVIRVRGMGYAEIQREFGALLEAIIETDEKTGRRVITADAIRELLNRCDDVGHAYDPLGAAVFSLLLERDGQIALTDS